MIISYNGGESFKISQGDTSLAINPASKISADVTIFSGVKNDISDKSGFVIDGPGEYEVKGMTIKGYLSKAASGLNTIYMINFEGLSLCFLGALSDPALGAETLEELEDIDILFAPVASLGPAVSYKLAVSLEPGIIIPMHYDNTSLAQFLKEGGEDKIESIDKLVIKKKDLEGKEGDIILLKEE
ncbi:MAG: MBL fold metallo-hydrolase [bacterium]|nr:MBL fold metallo-hydrolase [bacterium]